MNNRSDTEVKKELITVSKEFVLEAHRSACADWKRKIEKEFPALFKIWLGKKGFPTDNSYCVHAVTGEPYKGVGPAGNFSTLAREVTIISDPYIVKVEGFEREFVTVLDSDGTPYRILNRIEPTPRPKNNYSCIGYSGYPYNL